MKSMVPWSDPIGSPWFTTETKRIQSINQWEDIHGIPWISQILHTYQSFLLFTHACCRSTAASVVEKWLCHAVSAIKPPGKLQRVCPDIKENSFASPAKNSWWFRKHVMQVSQQILRAAWIWWRMVVSLTTDFDKVNFWNRHLQPGSIWKVLR